MSSNYSQGYSKAATDYYQTRSVSDDAGFLIPHIKPTDHILDVGCGPGSITLGLARHAPQGRTTGIDISQNSVDLGNANLAKLTGDDASLKQRVNFHLCNVLEGLPFQDNTFDVIFTSQVLVHLPQANDDAAIVKVLEELKRVLKPGGIMASRESSDIHWYPHQPYNVGVRWGERLMNTLGRTKQYSSPPSGSEQQVEWVGSRVPKLYRRAGFRDMKVVAGTKPHTTRESVASLREQMAGRFRDDGYKKGFRRAGYSEEEIDDAARAIEDWGRDKDAWYVIVQCDILGWK